MNGARDMNGRQPCFVPPPGEKNPLGRTGRFGAPGFRGAARRQALGSLRRKIADGRLGTGSLPGTAVFAAPPGSPSAIPTRRRIHLRGEDRHDGHSFLFTHQVSGRSKD
jgi:hypothetical protein